MKRVVRALGVNRSARDDLWFIKCRSSLQRTANRRLVAMENGVEMSE